MHVYMLTDHSLRKCTMLLCSVADSIRLVAHFDRLTSRAQDHSAELGSALIIELTGMYRPGWYPANKPKAVKRFPSPMSEWSPHTVSSTCLCTRSPEYTSEAKVCAKPSCMLDWLNMCIVPDSKTTPL